MHETPRPVVVFAGGGTGGHLYPALALAQGVLEVRPDVRPFFVGASRGIEARILPDRGVEHALLPVEGFPRGGGLSGLRAVPALGRSVLAVLDLLRSLRPEMVVVTGGYAGGPAGIGAGILGIPLALQEQNAVPGVTTRLLSLWARQVHVAFPEAIGLLPRRARKRVRVTGNPVRPAPSLDVADARAAFGLPSHGTVVLAVGGSQGSAALNQVLAEAVQGVEQRTLRRPADLLLLWATGPTHHDGVSRALGAAGSPSWVHAVPYVDDMPAALTAADLAVSRAGAMATAELLNHGLPAVLVPLPTAAADHQSRNAFALAAAGAAVVAEEAGLTGAALWDRVVELVEDDALRERMAAAARARACPQATTEIVADLLGLLPGGAR
ncbi:MAG: undecaprenyldiphospho-muramoylpentapeptide beta-N-acetylglucosaminyltransferase [Gemmatimonadetes bacterium]|nr:undecaprenyldiphospho-muramoylpentapeptide beta-N-acetylglucosaminyltransferase [Gemmatimonadota bacterium]